MAAKAVSRSSTKLSSKKRLKRTAQIPSDRAIKRIAAIEFSPMDIDLAECMTNAQLGAKMPSVRIALAILQKSKPDMIKMITSMDEGDLLKEDGLAREMLDRLDNSFDQFKGLADICNEARRRFLIAAHAVAARGENRE